MVPAVPFYIRSINLVHLLWLGLFTIHNSFVWMEAWYSGYFLLFLNLAFLAVGAILHVRPGSLKSWGRPSKPIQSVFSFGYMIAMLLSMLSLYDLHYISV